MEIDYTGPLFKEEDRRPYQWDAWLDGKAHVITAPADVDDVRKFRAACWMQAQRRGHVIVTRLQGDHAIIIQACPGVPR